MPRTPIEAVETLPPAEAAALRRPSPLASWALGAAGSGLLALLIVAALVRIGEATSADGRIVAAAAPQRISHPRPGIVDEVHVRDGDEVQPGQLLLRIAEAGAGGEHAENRARMAALAAQAARLEAEAAGRPEPDFPADAAPGAEHERKIFHERQRALAAELRPFEDERRDRARELAEQDGAVAKLAEKLAALRADIAMLRRQGAGKAGRHELSVLERAAQTTEERLAEERFRLPLMQAAIDEAQRRIAERKRTFAEDAQRALGEVRAEIARLEAERQKLAGAVIRSEVRAPLGGIVARLRAGLRGARIGPGETLLEIAPGSDGLAIEARMRTRAGALVAVGQRALVTIAGDGGQTLAALEGRVVEIGREPTALPAEAGPGAYRILVRIERAELDRARDGHAPEPGAPVHVTISTGDVSLLAYLFRPAGTSARRTGREDPLRPSSESL